MSPDVTNLANAWLTPCKQTIENLMRILDFQHIDCEHPGSLRTFLRRDNIEWDAINLHAGDTIPSFDDYSALWVTGGPMDIWDIDEHPWLIPEKAAIRKWVKELKKPYLGLCLGHQLLADALGGTCGPQMPPEIGILDVQLTTEGKEDRIFSRMPANHKCLQWHSVHVAQPPEGATILEGSDICRVQSMRVGSNAWSTQYHVEIEPDTVPIWGKIPAYHKALVETLGEGGFSSMQTDADDHMPDFISSAETLYQNFIESARGNDRLT